MSNARIVPFCQTSNNERHFQEEENQSTFVAKKVVSSQDA